jgi:hypothetical protein
VPGQLDFCEPLSVPYPAEQQRNEFGSVLLMELDIRLGWKVQHCHSAERKDVAKGQEEATAGSREVVCLEHEGQCSVLVVDGSESALLRLHIAFDA